MAKKRNKKDHEKPRKSKGNHVPIWAILIAIVAGVLFYHVLTAQDETMLYSDFKQYLREGKVQRVFLGESLITGELKRADASAEPMTFTTVKIDDPDLVSELEAQGVQYSGKQSQTWISDLISWGIPIILLVVMFILIFKRIGPGSSVMSFGKSRAKFYEEDEMKVTFDDVAGIDEAKEELIEIIDFLKNPEKFTQLGGKIPKGALLVGAPGTGKTLLAKAVAGEAQVPFLNISGSAFVEMFVGVGASRVRDLFSQAQHKAPCIIFIDELDALGKTRGVNPVGGHDEREQTLNQLLVEMDGFDSRSGVIIMAATNRPEILDQALLRPGRFDRQIFVDRPDIKGREQILQVHAKDVKLAENVDFQVIAGRTPGFVGADLANIINEAALLAARRNKKAVEMSDLEEAIDRVVAGLEKKSRVMTKKEKEMTAYHEAGHALVASFLPNATPVHKVSIIPRGFSLGVTMFLPTEDRYLMTKAELLDQIGTALGGRVAEELIFHEVSSGARDDLKRATEIARMMVKEYGMSDKLGLVTFESNHSSSLFLGRQGSGEGLYSDETAYQIDAEVKTIIDNTYLRVRQILETQLHILKELAQVLLEKEVIEKEEFEAIVQAGEPTLAPAHADAETAESPGASEPPATCPDDGQAAEATTLDESDPENMTLC
ncbi:ATP-dependent zinc metalloprotease FtsH [candidate division KSB3 bacterium]|uniref:ATP-dependent zinc metalloprotease FtsH n=1 Tax=candidate division KSB3 bacterium TaxID=2044937 RepID=A0A9D5Q7D4_9BACT|nr:ATP-dependent zinc metalloprotease FtsH [candidate division KSB3 bacterium]MBD3326789.1 ATP-dependent zinc metalloprotease FtsH [candidate division KSB3 bacterium]